MTNEALREYSTSVGFQITLSKRMIDTLVALDHFKGSYHELVQWEYRGDRQRIRQWAGYVSTVHALQHRGLMRVVHKYKDGYRDVKASRHQLTRAGKLVVSLLKEAGIYHERVTELGLLEEQSVA